MSEKNKHFITIVSPLGDSVIVDTYLTKEEYEVVNRISVLFADVASINEPILVISKPITDLVAPDEEAVLPPVAEND